MTRYNGWTNWATWNAALWIGNDETIYRDQQRVVRRAYKKIGGDTVKAFFLVWFPTGTPDMDVTDIGKIDFDEIAEHWEAERLELEEEDAA